MAVYTAVPTVATGDMWTAANHNTYVRDNLAFFKNDFIKRGSAAVGSFTTTSTTFVDITGASINLVLSVPAMVFLVASGDIKADQAAYSSEVAGSIDGTETFLLKKDGADGLGWVPFGAVYSKASVQAGTCTCKLRLKTTNAAMAARVADVQMIALAIAN